MLQAQEPRATVQPIPGGRVQVSRGIHSARPGSGPPLLQRRQVGGRATSLRSHKYKPTSLNFDILRYPLCLLFNRFPLVDIILHDDESRLPGCRLTVRL